MRRSLASLLLAACLAASPAAAERLLVGNSDQAIALSRIVTDLPPDIAAQAYDEGMAIFLDDGHFDPESVAVIERAIPETGLVADLPPNDRLFTEAFLP